MLTALVFFVSINSKVARAISYSLTCNQENMQEAIVRIYLPLYPILVLEHDVKNDWSPF